MHFQHFSINTTTYSEVIYKLKKVGSKPRRNVQSKKHVNQTAIHIYNYNYYVT